VSDDSDLISISDKLRLMSINDRDTDEGKSSSGNSDVNEELIMSNDKIMSDEELIMSDEELARMLQVTVFLNEILGHSMPYAFERSMWSTDGQ